MVLVDRNGNSLAPGASVARVEGLVIKDLGDGRMLVRVGDKLMELVASHVTDADLVAIHGHEVADVAGLQTALDGKAAASHSHEISDVNSLQSKLDEKAAVAHTHSIANVTGLQAALDGKSATGHGHAIADVALLQTYLNTYATAISGNTSAIATKLDSAVVVRDYRATDVVVNNNNSSYTTAFTLALEAGATYALHGFFLHDSTTTADFVIKWTSLPSGASGYYVSDLDNQVATAISITSGMTFNRTGGDGQVQVANIRGEIATSSAGNLVLGVKQSAAEAYDSRLVTGSWVKAIRMN